MSKPSTSSPPPESSSSHSDHALPPPPPASSKRWWPRLPQKRKLLIPERLNSMQVEVLDLVEEHKERFFGYWDYLIILLSFYTLLTLGLQVLFELPVVYVQLFSMLDFGVCITFMLDFCLRLYMAPVKSEYIKWGWIDLISSLPQLEGLRWGRALRLVRIIRAFRSMRFMHKKLEDRLSDPFALVLFVSFILITFGAMSILYLESPLKEGNIKTAEQALWWVFVTMTTVGYGDFYPVSMEGRILAGLLMSAGVGIFGIFTVKCTQILLSSAHEEDEKHLQEIHDEVKQLRLEIRELKALLFDQQRPPTFQSISNPTEADLLSQEGFNPDHPQDDPVSLSESQINEPPINLNLAALNLKANDLNHNE